MKAFKAFKAFIKPFEAPQRSMKIKIKVNFFSSSGIGTGRVNRSGATRAVTVHISTTFDRAWQADLLHKLKSYGISVRYLILTRLFSVINGLSVSGWEFFTRVSSKFWNSSRLHSWSNTFPTIY